MGYENESWMELTQKIIYVFAILKNMIQICQYESIYGASWSRNNALDLFAVDVRFESRPGH
jgi:hypothetical protein